MLRLIKGGASWERFQYASAANTGAREYRATNAAMRKLETAAMEALRTVSTNAAHWEVIPLADRSVSFRNKAFKLSSALACSLSAKHMRVHSKGPFTGFLWLGSPHGLKAEYDRHTCKQVLGSWLEAWCAYWARNGGLDTRGATADLTAAVVLLQEDMGESEAGHASIRRELVLLSNQVRACDFLEVSDRFVLRCCRRHP